jgi:4-amino-4-deoxy-L-arabinose transferase-like glycosyltransferase
MKIVQVWIKSVPNRPIVCLYLILICYATLLLPTVYRQGISWDEQTDIDIARAYLVRPDGWLRGSPSDPSQTRLPMAVVAVVYALLRTDDLLTARLISCFVGALTIVGVFVFCERDFDRKRGLLACAVLATSPFFLSFAKTAFTETDIYVACAFVWLLAALSRLRERGTVGWAAVTAVALGLALSGKFTTVVIFPVIVFHIQSFPKEQMGERLSKRELRNGIAFLALMSAIIVLGWLNLNALAPEWREDALLRFHFILALGGWIAVLVWAARQRNKIVSPLWLTGFVLVLALGTFMVAPPDHTTNPNIIASLIDRFNHEMGWNPAFMGEAAVLHLASVIFKSSPVLGVGLLVSLLTTALQWKTMPKTRLLMLIVAFYFLGLILLPLAQTFYMIPVLPLLTILGADQLLTLMARRKTLAIGIGVLAVIGLCVDLALCYPDFNLNGYQWLGARYLGNRSTIGYRSVVQTTSDGVQQVAQWLDENARPGDRVAAYVYEWHILEAICADSRLRLTPGKEISVRLRPDYVIIHINHTIRQSWAAFSSGDENNARAASVFWTPYDEAWLRTHYTKIATVPRAFGIEMASVWERNDRIEGK